MRQQPREPAWWMLYALVPLMGGLFVVEHRAALSPRWHTFVQISIVLFIYGLVWLWLSAQTLAYDRQDEESRGPHGRGEPCGGRVARGVPDPAPGRWA
jgi:uncharacterized membrane protein YhaH (DUF805 family)